MLKQILMISALSLGISLFLVYFFQRHFIYFPTPQKPLRQDYHASDMIEVSIQTQDQINLISWYKPAQSHQATLVFLHGNAGHIGYRMPLIRQFIHAGFGVLLLEYRGYGANKGQPSEQGLYQDGRAALQFLSKQGIKTQQIILYGESLGTGVASKLAAENPVCAVILQSPFTSLVSLANYHYPWLFIKPMDKFDTLKRIKQIHAPLLILHGKRDQIVPFAQGVTLFEQANTPKKMLTFDKQNHNDLWDAPDFFKEIITFINDSCSKTTTP